MKAQLNDFTACGCTLFDDRMSFPFSAESRFLQSVDEDNMTKQPGVSAVFLFLIYLMTNTKPFGESFFSPILQTNTLTPSAASTDE